MSPIVSSAQGSGKTYATETFLAGLQGSAKKRCVATSLLRKCFSVNQETCESRVTGNLQSCIRDQRIKLMGQQKLIELTARSVEQEIGECVHAEYFTLNRSSYRPSAACEAFARKHPGTAAATPAARAEARSQIFEDPLEEQRSLTDNYKLHLISDLRKVRTFKSDLTARKVCPGYRGKDLSGCFRQGLASFDFTSSPQIVDMMVVATYAGVYDKESGYAKGRENMVDNVLAILERSDLHKFHLAKFRPAGEVDQQVLVELRKQDEDMLKVVMRRTNETLSPYVKENGGRLKRQPASAVDFRGRLDFQLQREWSY